MASQFLFISACTSVVVIATLFVMRFSKTSRPPPGDAEKIRGPATVNSVLRPMVELTERLKSKLPGKIVLTRDDAYQLSAKGHWAEQECEEIPACVVQPQDSDQLCSAVQILSDRYNKQIATVDTSQTSNFFAVRAGGHSAVAGAASIKGGVLIDLSRLNKVELSEDRLSVNVGAGARWMDVSKLLDKEGLAAAGGRNSHVGVGGLTLGGGISWFSPQFGFVCSNVIEYEVVLASGTLVTASESTNSDLWQALKGGANNFGIVTRFRFRCFPSGDIWSGFLYMPSFQASKALAAFHQSVKQADPSLATYDKYAAGPITCFTYLQAVGIQVVSVNLVYTKPSEVQNKWPSYWRSTPFQKIWRFWSTCKNRTLTDGTDELNSLNPPGRRQSLAATTIKNDTATLDAAYQAYKNAITSIRRVKGISWTLVMQPLVPEWARKGDPNPLGLDAGSSEPLVIVSFTVNWADEKDDDFAKSETRRVVEEIEAFAQAHNTAHRYRYLNYCDDWQDPFVGYGEENREFLRNVSRKYDSSGLFQKACAGGFKLWA